MKKDNSEKTLSNVIFQGSEGGAFPMLLSPHSFFINLINNLESLQISSMMIRNLFIKEKRKKWIFQGKLAEWFSPRFFLFLISSAPHWIIKRNRSSSKDYSVNNLILQELIESLTWILYGEVEISRMIF